MAKVSSVNKNNKRKKISLSFQAKRAELKKRIYDKKISIDERFSLVARLAQLPRAGSFVRVRNRCVVTGRPRGCLRKFGLSRNIVRDFAGKGFLPGVVKSSW